MSARPGIFTPKGLMSSAGLPEHSRDGWDVRARRGLRHHDDQGEDVDDEGDGDDVDEDVDEDGDGDGGEDGDEEGEDAGEDGDDGDADLLTTARGQSS